MKHVSLSILEYEFTHTACITFVVWSCVGWEAELQSGVPTHHTILLWLSCSIAQTLHLTLLFYSTKFYLKKTKTSHLTTYYKQKWQKNRFSQVQQHLCKMILLFSVLPYPSLPWVRRYSQQDTWGQDKIYWLPFWSALVLSTFIQSP